MGNKVSYPAFFFFFPVLQYYFRCTPSVYKSNPKWYTESVQTKSLDPEENQNQLLFYSFHQLADLLRKKSHAFRGGYLKENG